MSNIPWLESDLWFPSIFESLDDPDGLLAAGGDLSVPRLALAYRSGIFPWYSDGQPILWWSPNTRCIIDLEHLHISKSLRKLLNKRRYTISFDVAFETVISACASPRDYTDSTWITEEMQAAYINLHKSGYAHSLEVWEEKENGQKDLVGGLYGIAIGKCFFGESMFSLVPNASKIAFVYLVNQLSNWGYRLIDCQLENAHLTSMGAYTISKQEFFTILNKEVVNNHPNKDWELTWQW